MTRQPGALKLIALLLPFLGACGSTPVDSAVAEPAPPADFGSAAVLSQTCSGCHGPAGGAMVRLDGRSAPELRAALLRYRSDTDGGSVMHRMMRGYSEADIDAISVYLSEGASE